MNIPDSLPLIEKKDIVEHLKERRDFICGDFTGLNSEFAYVVRKGDVAICFVCVHGELYVRRDPRREWGTTEMAAVLMAYGLSGVIAQENQVPCSDKMFTLACFVHNIQDDSSENLGTDDLAGLAESILRNSGTD